MRFIVATAVRRPVSLFIECVPCHAGDGDDQILGRPNAAGCVCRGTATDAGPRFRSGLIPPNHPPVCVHADATRLPESVRDSIRPSIRPSFPSNTPEVLAQRVPRSRV